MSTHDLVALIILIIVLYLCIHSVIHRICVCVEQCAYAKCGLKESKKVEEVTESE